MEVLQKQVDEQGDDIEDVDERVTQSEEKTEEMDQILTSADEKMVDISEEVDDLNTRVDTAEDELVEVVEKVEEIDYKVMVYSLNKKAILGETCCLYNVINVWSFIVVFISVVERHTHSYIFLSLYR